MGITISANGQIQTAKLNCEISSEWEEKTKNEPSKDFSIVNGTKEDTRPKALQGR